MSYIRANKVRLEGDYERKDVRIYPQGDSTLNSDMDFEMLNFVLGVIGQIDSLEEGEALVIWKEIF